MTLARNRSMPDFAVLPVLHYRDVRAAVAWLCRAFGARERLRIREHPATRLTPVVILTSSCEDRDRLEGYSLGANSYIRKPVDFPEFVEAVRQLGLYWLVINQPPPPVQP
jgi:hypothetical protein